GRWHELTLPVGNPTETPLVWIRFINAAAAFLPWSIWLLKEAILGKNNERDGILWRPIPWFAIAIGLALLCLSDRFFASHANEGRTPDNSRFLFAQMGETLPGRGPAYFA